MELEKKEMPMGCARCGLLRDSSWAVQAKSVPVCVFLFCTDFQRACCLGIGSSCHVAGVEEVILCRSEWLGEMPPTVGSGASSFLHSEHPLSDLMNQNIQEKSAFWLMSISSLIIF